MRFAFITDFIFLFTGAAPVFPPELVDCILDELATPPLSTLSRRTLTSCTLVCHTWLPRSSAYLLNNVTISSSRLEQYLAFAETSTRLATYAREFIVCGTIDVTMYLGAIFSVMPNVDCLEVWNNSTTTFATPPTTIPLLNHVDLTSILDIDSRAAEIGRFVLSHFKLSFAPVASIAGFLRPFRHVETLELEDMRGTFLDNSSIPYPLVKVRYAERYPLSAPVTCSMRNITLNDCCTSAVTGMLAYISLRPIAITLQGLYPRNAWSLLEFLQDVGKNTEHLTLILPVGPTGELNAMWKSTFQCQICHVRGTDVCLQQACFPNTLYMLEVMCEVGSVPIYRLSN